MYLALTIVRHPICLKELRKSSHCLRFIQHGPLPTRSSRESKVEKSKVEGQGPMIPAELPHFRPSTPTMVRLDRQDVRVPARGDAVVTGSDSRRLSGLRPKDGVQGPAVEALARSAEPETFDPVVVSSRPKRGQLSFIAIRTDCLTGRIDRRSQTICPFPRSTFNVRRSMFNSLLLAHRTRLPT